mmetsp:Transcript_4863/g.11359  ORF Transcript_4863/g.11359 Transcript_4863/m.11359 type:complete len:240 (-) Transcript_4863:792-1511(-)
MLPSRGCTGSRNAPPESQNQTRPRRERHPHRRSCPAPAPPGCPPRCRSTVGGHQLQLQRTTPATASSARDPPPLRCRIGMALSRPLHRGSSLGSAKAGLPSCTASIRRAPGSAATVPTTARVAMKVRVVMKARAVIENALPGSAARMPPQMRSAAWAAVAQRHTPEAWAWEPRCPAAPSFEASRAPSHARAAAEASEKGGPRKSANATTFPLGLQWRLRLSAQLGGPCWQRIPAQRGAP